MEILEWRHCGPDRLLVLGDSSEKETNYTWHRKFCKGSMEKLQTCLGMSRDWNGAVAFSHVRLSFGMTILETAANIVVPDQ